MEGNGSKELGKGYNLDSASKTTSSELLLVNTLHTIQEDNLNHKLFPLDLQLFDKESRTTQLVFSYQGGKKVSKKTKSDKSLCTMMY